MHLRPSFLVAAITLALVSTGWHLVDDDEHEEHDKHEEGRREGEKSEHCKPSSVEKKSSAEGKTKGSSHSEGKSGHSEEGEGLSLPAVSNKSWSTECSSCHARHPPGLLPARSWKALMGGLENHFGEKVALETAARDEILAFLVANSGDGSPGARANEVVRSIPAASTPLRITETPFFREAHHEVAEDVFKRPKIGTRSNCVACHPGAEQGQFSEETVRIPQ